MQSDDVGRARMLGLQRSQRPVELKRTLPALRHGKRFQARDLTQHTSRGGRNGRPRLTRGCTRRRRELRLSIESVEENPFDFVHMLVRADVDSGALGAHETIEIGRAQVAERRLGSGIDQWRCGI